MAMREWTRPRPMVGCHFEDRRNRRPSRNPAIAKLTKAVISPIEPPTLRSTPIAGFRRRPTLAPYRHDRTVTNARSWAYEGRLYRLRMAFQFLRRGRSQMTPLGLIAAVLGVVALAARDGNDATPTSGATGVLV